MSKIALRNKTGRLYTVTIWVVLAWAVIGPVAIAATSPLLGARTGVYIMAGMAGVVALALLFVQPLLATGFLPGLKVAQARLWHRWVGTGIAIGVALHVGGLYLISPSDALDALLLVAPTPFSIYGVIGMRSVVFTIILVVLRSRMGFGYNAWRIIHNGLSAIVVVTSVVHALMIEGTMGSLSKQILCFFVVAIMMIASLFLRVIKPIFRKR
jgi:predicted ferric reductase